jgi:heme oxygenase
LAALLAERLRLETRDLHAAAERSGVMGALLRGQLALPGYRAMLCNLLAIYLALEMALEARRADPLLAPLRLRELYRAQSLAHDLAALAALGAPAGEEAGVEPAALDYSQRLAGLAATASPALVAHAYVRYLGDLYGGQTLGRVVARAYRLGPEATRFYAFGGEAQVLSRQQAFRAALAALPATPAEADLIVAEARWGFEQHCRLFEQLAQRPAV